jgi:hypothetical protein
MGAAKDSWLLINLRETPRKTKQRTGNYRSFGREESGITRDQAGGDSVLGGLVVFFEFLRRIGYCEAVREHLPFSPFSQCERSGEDLHGIFAFGGSGSTALRAPACCVPTPPLHALLGISRFPIDDTVRNLFKRFGQGHRQRFFSGLWNWQFERLPECMENRIAELKHDLTAGDFCLQEFFATEGAFRSILLLFNLLGKFQRCRPGHLSPARHVARSSVPLRGSTRSRRPPFDSPSVVFLGRLAKAHPTAGTCLNLGHLNFAEVASVASNLNAKADKNST